MAPLFRARRTRSHIHDSRPDPGSRPRPSTIFAPRRTAPQFTIHGLTPAGPATPDPHAILPLAMPEFVIEREIPGIGQMSEAEIRDVSVRSLEVLKSIGSQIQWLHSYVTDDRLYCVYLAPDEAIDPAACAAARCAGQPDLGRAPAHRSQEIRLSVSHAARRTVPYPARRSSDAVRPSFQACANASSLMRVRAIDSVRSMRSRSAGLARRADLQPNRGGGGRPAAPPRRRATGSRRTSASDSS